MKTSRLIVAGLHGSEAEHWQSWWQLQDPQAQRVPQDDWHHPQLETWTARLQQSIAASTSEKVWLVAHSFGCLISVKAALVNPEKIAGLFLVAPADPQRFDIAASELAATLPVPSLVIASTTDPYLSLEKAKAWATIWGSQFINLGDVGHINVASGFGAWPQGMELFEYFCSQFSEQELVDFWRLSA